jgi:2-polyprenyl-6-methoxyphenol hydroxylase-like FAD-dependent oxidoreductase
MEVAGDQDGRVVFDAATQGTDALAWIVDVPALEARLQDAVRFQPLVEMVTEPVAAPLTVVCEGRASRTREEFGAQFDVTPIPSTPLPHGWTASTPTGRWRASGLRQTAAFWPSAAGWPPGPWRGGGWSCSPPWRRNCRPWTTNPLPPLAASQGTLGALRTRGARVTWPLQQAVARHWCGALAGQQGASWVLAGDAAHNVHRWPARA